ncbi:hypothetical protein [Sphingomonas gellani]|nr:hypothetical protein [Sphingomonas gellani]
MTAALVLFIQLADPKFQMLLAARAIDLDLSPTPAMRIGRRH